MTTRELIELLKQYPGDLFVAYSMYSEQVLMKPEDIHVVEFGEPRPDGWVPDKRYNTGSRKYLLFPGN